MSATEQPDKKNVSTVPISSLSPVVKKKGGTDPINDMSQSTAEKLRRRLLRYGMKPNVLAKIVKCEESELKSVLEGGQLSEDLALKLCYFFQVSLEFWGITE